MSVLLKVNGQTAQSADVASPIYYLARLTVTTENAESFRVRAVLTYLFTLAALTHTHIHTRHTA